MASYKEAVRWIAKNDDCYWLGDYDLHGMSVTAYMVRDIWNKSNDKIIKDIKKALKIVYPNHEALK